MPRAFGIDAVANAIGTDRKWLDNLLSHHDIHGVEKLGHGVPRRLDPDSVKHLFLTRTLMQSLGSPAARALQLAAELAQGKPVTVAQGIEIRVDTDLLASILAERVRAAVEVAQPRRRGRPPRRG